MKMWKMLIGDILTDDHRLDEHARVFRQSDYEISALYRSLLNSDDFWDAQNRASIIQSPASLTIGAIRSTGLLPTEWQTCLLYTSPSPRDRG